MGFYDRHVLPRLVDLTCGSAALFPIRQWTCEGLSGDVVELGFGSGRNVGAYPAAVASVAAIEPSDTAWSIAGDRVASASVPILRSGLDGERIPFADNTFDAALSTFTLCTIPDLRAALGEVVRVVKDGGSLHFLEHGLAPDEHVRRWQRRLDPLERRVAGGCHLTRDVTRELTDAGLTITSIKQFYGARPKSLGFLSVGVARIG